MSTVVGELIASVPRPAVTTGGSGNAVSRRGAGVGVTAGVGVDTRGATAGRTTGRTTGGVVDGRAGKEAVAGLLMVGTIVGILMATYLNNAGGAWDNAKKYIEMGHHGGKKSFAHQAAVTGDTVGDPFKDTSGPSLHVLIKLFATLTLALAALFV